MTDLVEKLAKVVIDLTARVKALEKALAVKVPTAPKPRSIVAEYVRQAAMIHMVETVDIMGTNRTREVSNARQWVMYEASEAGCNTVKIGKELGGRDHSTVLHGIRAERTRRLQTVHAPWEFVSRRGGGFNPRINPQNTGEGIKP